MTRARMRLRWKRYHAGASTYHFGSAQIGWAGSNYKDKPNRGCVLTGKGGRTFVYEGPSLHAAKRAVRAFVKAEMRRAVR